MQTDEEIERLALNEYPADPASFSFNQGTIYQEFDENEERREGFIKGFKQGIQECKLLQQQQRFYDEEDMINAYIEGFHYIADKPMLLDDVAREWLKLYNSQK